MYDATMGFTRRIAFAFRASRQDFSLPVVPTQVDQIITANRQDGWSPAITRETALQVPAVLRGRNLICNISTLPLVQYDTAKNRVRSSLLSQIDPQVPNVVVIAQTVEDLLFEGIGWWHVTGRGWNDFPTSAEHVAAHRVHLTPPPGAESVNMLPSGADPRAAVWIDTRIVPGKDMLRFDSPNPPLLTAARSAIRRALKFEKTAERYADDPRPLDYFTPADGADPADDAEIGAALSQWEDSRRKRSTAYVPASMNYNVVQQMSAADLQLVQLQARAALDIANAIGVDPEDLGISTTSRTYQNATDRRQDRINDVLAPYMRAIADRLSMDDVTRRGYEVRFDLADYLKADPVTRATVAKTMSDIGAVTIDEIREAEGRPTMSKSESTVSALSRAEFSANEVQSIDFGASVEFKADPKTRTVTGLLLPFGVVGRNKAGRWKFAEGSITWPKSAVSRVKLNREHDRSALIGSGRAISATESGIFTEFKIARGPLGDQALSEAEDLVLDGLSAEVDVIDYENDPSDPSVFLVTRATLTGAALTGNPAFDDARLTSVAASSNEGKIMDTDNDKGATNEALTRNDVNEMFAKFMQENTPAIVNPRRETHASVGYEAPYRFGEFTGKGEHSFSSDLLNARSNWEAQGRIDAFVKETFATATTDINELNPTRNRPDLYVDQRTYSSPVWDAINKGSIGDQTPFTVPKFNSAASLVGDHTEGTEPSVGSFTTTSQTITPTPISGKVELNREVIDQGGNPRVDTLVWRQMNRAYREALEAKAVALLDGVTPTGITLTAGSADSTLADEIEAAFVALQYVRGGFSMDTLFLQIDLFKALAAASDSTGRKLYPLYAPQNADGSVAQRFRSIDVAGVIGYPAWGLAATGSVAASSYLFDRESVHGWASAPMRMDFDYQVKSVFVGLWGYAATAVTDINGVREVVYDPVA